MITGVYEPLKRPCKRCNKLFVPHGKCSKVCGDCNLNLNGKRKFWVGFKRDSVKKHYFDEEDHLIERQDEKTKYKTVYKKGRGIKCYSQNKS